MATLRLIADEIGDALNRPFDWMFKERVKSIFRHEAATIVRQAIDKDGVDDHFKTMFSIDISIVDDSTVPCGSDCGTIRSTNKLATPLRYKTDEPFTFVGNKDGTIIYIYTKLPELRYANMTAAYLNEPVRYIYINGYIYVKDGKVCGTVTSIVDYSDTVAGTVKITSNKHGLKSGYKINLTGTSYDGEHIITVIDKDNFYITATYTNNETSGTWTRVLTVTCINVEGVYPLGSMLDNTNENMLNGNVFDDDTELPIPEDLIQAIKVKLLTGELSILDNRDKAPDTNLDN